jgi:hypothetical protein
MTKQRKFEVRQGLSGYCFVGQGHGTGSTNPGLVTVVHHTLEHHEKVKGHWCIFFVFHLTPLTVVSECMTSNDSMISKKCNGKDGHWKGCGLISNTIIQFFCRTWGNTRGKSSLSAFRLRFEPEAEYEVLSNVHLPAIKFMISWPSCPIKNPQ